MKKPINLYALWPSLMALAAGASYYLLCRAESIASFPWVMASGLAAVLPSESLVQAQYLGFVPSMLFSFSLAYGLRKMNLNSMVAGAIATAVVLLNEVLQLAGIMRGMADVWDFLAACAAAGLAVFLAAPKHLNTTQTLRQSSSYLSLKAQYAYWAICTWLAGHALIVLAS